MVTGCYVCVYHLLIYKVYFLIYSIFLNISPFHIQYVFSYIGCFHI